MKKLLSAIGVLLAAGVLLIGVGIVEPDAPVAGPAADAALALLEGGDAGAAGPVRRKRTYYQYVEGGQVHFAEKLADVPEAWRSRAGRVELDVPPPGTPADARRARAARASAALAGGKARAARAPGGAPLPQIIVYGAPSWSEESREAIAYLDEQGIPYEFKDVDDGANFVEMQDFSGSDYVPIIKVGKAGLVKGWSRRRFERLLKSGG